MGKNVVDADELEPPFKRVQDVSLLGHKLVIVVGDADEVEELVDAWVGFLQVLGRDEHAGQADEGDNIRTRLALEVLDARQVLLNVGALQVSIKDIYTMVERLGLDTQTIRKITHPVDEHFSALDVESIRVVESSEPLTLRQAF